MTFRQLLHHLNLRNTRLLPSKKFFVITFLIILSGFSIFFSLKTITAQTEPNTTAAGNLIKQKQDAIEKGNNQEAWLDSSLSSNMMSLLISLGGKIPFDEDGNLNLNTSYIPGGAIGTGTNMISSLYYQPVSGIEYLAQVKDNFLGKPAYAQNTGFQGLSPLLPAWKAIRNIVYVFVSLVFITIGIMIMLRVKISPQATVTIQNSIPKIITTLVLVTFSYAIAGFVIDLTKLILAFGLSLFFQIKGKGYGEDLLPTKFTEGGGIPIISWLGNLIKMGYDTVAGWFVGPPNTHEKLSNMSFFSIYELTNRAIPAASGIALGEMFGQIMVGTILGGVGSAVLGGLGRDLLVAGGTVIGDVVGGIGGIIIIPLIIAIFMVIFMIKLYFGLVKCYITLIFKIIIGPLQIGLGAFPSAKSGFSQWITEIAANAVVFPITSLFVVALNYLTDVLSGGGLWIPSQISMNTISGNMAVVSAGVGLAGLAALSKLPKLVPEAVFKLKPDAFGTAMGESFAPVGKFAQKRGQIAASDAKNEFMQRHTQTSPATGQSYYNPGSRFSTVNKAGEKIWYLLGKRNKWKN